MPELPLEGEPSPKAGVGHTQSPTCSVSSVLPMHFLSHLSCSMILRLSSQ